MRQARVGETLRVERMAQDTRHSRPIQPFRGGAAWVPQRAVCACSLCSNGPHARDGRAGHDTGRGLLSAESSGLHGALVQQHSD